MPYIPHHLSNGRLSDLVQTGIHDAIRRAVDNTDRPVLPNNDFAIRASGLSSFDSVNASAIYAVYQQHSRQVVATAMSSLSLVSALVAMYWFYMMRRNFRRDLVLLLIVGGFWKSLWFVVFSAGTFMRGSPIETESVFCQANGYLLQVGFEACDFAVLFMSMHMYLQIFPTTYLGLGHDGLYRLRHWVFAAWVILPNLSAALAFVNPRPGFMAQGGFCSLPLRPHWYRLALFWGPRYLIWCYVVFVAVRIYRYVGSEFKVFGQEKDNSSSMGVPGGSSLDRAAKAEHHRFREQRHAQRLSSLGLEQDDIDDKDCAPDDVSGMSRLSPPKTSATETSKTHPQNGSRRQSTPNVLGGIDRSGSEISTMAVMNRSCPNSRRGSHQIANAVTGEDFAAPPNPDCRGHRGSIFSLASVRSSTAQSIDESPELAPIQEGRKVSAESNQQRQNASRAMQLRRRAIQRQLRLLFIYPCIYMMLWVIPLAVNIMNYTDYFAQNPVFALGILQVICITFMTFADVVIFCWRERPWRHIPGSDGTFLGSFMWWQYCFESTWAQDRRASRAPSTVVDEKDEGDEKSQSHTGLRGSLKRWSMSLKGSSPRGSDTSGAPQVSARAAVTHKRTFSGGSDRKHREAEAAYERLALERADYENNRRSLQERRASVISQLQHAPPERKEWFDKQMDADLFQDREAVEKEERGDA